MPDYTSLRHSTPFVATIIFLATIVVYLSNGRTLASGDTIANTLMGFNVLENHRIDFDNFRGSFHHHRDSYWFSESRDQHLVPLYPIGPAIVSFPICVGHWAYLKLVAGNLDVTSRTFENDRQTFEHLSSSIIAALGVVLFFLSSRLLFDAKTSCISTLVFAFATNQWVISSQALWQHGSANLMLLGTMHFLLLANRAQANKKRKILLLVAGILCGLLPVIRPPDVLFLIAFAAWCLVQHRKESSFFCLGLLSGSLGLMYNFRYYGNLLGGYTSMTSAFSLSQFPSAFSGILFSPNRGLLVYTPIVLLSLPGFLHLAKNIQAKNKDAMLILLFALTTIIYCAVFFFFKIWWGGHCYGPRFMTEAMPASIFLINYFLFAALRKNSLRNTLAIAAFIIIALYSVLVQLAGTFGNGGEYWNALPLNVDRFPERLWDFKDTQIKRHLTALRNRIVPPQDGAKEVQPYLSGKVLSLNCESQRAPLIHADGSLEVQAGAAQVLSAKVQNLGSIRWTGYLDADPSRRTYVTIKFLNLPGQEENTGGKLYVERSLRPLEQGIGRGLVVFPSQPGDYEFNAQIDWENIHGNQFTREPFLVHVRVLQ